MIIGYALTAAYVLLFSALIASTLLSRKEISKAFKGRMDRRSLLAAALIMLFFAAFSIEYVHPVVQLYFDDSIYQGIALNILHNGNALWCQYGTGYLTQCLSNQIYHDPVEWSFYLAIAFLAFGASTSTAYALQLFTGVLSIFFTFLLGSMFLGKRGGIASAAVFALIPELFIWSRVQATPDLGFMMFTTLAFICYMIYDRAKTTKTLVMFLSALGIALYMRIEGALLIPIFILIYLFSDPDINLKKRVVSIMRAKVDANALIIVAFFACLIPQIYYISYQLNSLDYGSGTICGTASNQTFSVYNFMCNITPNINYFLGSYTSVSYYPTYFSALTTIIAIIGVLLVYLMGFKDRGKILLILGIWIIAYHLFYDFFYAGSVTYGVDVRFMLQIYPAIAIFAGAGISLLSTLFGRSIEEIADPNNKLVVYSFSSLAFVVLLVIFAIYPFINALNIVTMLPQNMPQEPGPLTAINFIYNNYNAVPANCLVFSFTPDIWYEFNRSAAQIGYLGSQEPNFTVFADQYSCYVLDYGYWCVVPPYHGTTCHTDITEYNLTSIASEPAASGESGNLTLYTINNYTK